MSADDHGGSRDVPVALLERDIERAVPDDPEGATLRIREQLRFAAHLAEHRDDDEWQLLVQQAVETVQDTLSERPAADVAADVEETLAPLAEAASSYTLHYVGHAHIDMNWLWDFPETVDTTYRAFETMLDIMEEYPEFRFSQSQASTYAMVKEHAPDLYDRIRDAVDDGQWEVTANTWVEADKNMPAGESHARHLLYTNDFLREEFDLAYDDVRVDFEPDTFGHPNTVPKLLQQADVDYYYLGRSGGQPPAAQTPDAYQGVDGNFPELFWWEGPDGSRVLVFNTGDLWYNGHVEPQNAVNVLEFEAESGLRDYMITYGVGDHGGGPTREDIRTILEMNEWPVFPETTCDTVQNYFETVEAAAEDLLVVTDELNFFFRGCYSSQNRCKRENRSAENLLASAEAAAVVADCEADFDYPAERLADAWRTTLFHQFHDILPGAGIPETYDFAMGEYQRVEATGATVRDRALDAIVGDADLYHEDAPADAYDDGVPLVVFNPTATPQTGTVETVVFDYPDEWDLSNVVVEDAEGNATPLQVTLTRGEVQEGGLDGVLPEPSRLTHDALFGPDFAKVAFTVSDVPAVGYEVLWLREDVSETPDGVSVSYDGTTATLENEHRRVEIAGAAGAVDSLYDKDADREFVPDDGLFGLLAVEHEAPHGMSAWIRDQVVETDLLYSGWRVEVAEDGPGRGAIRCSRSYGDTDLSVTVRLAAGAETVDWTVDADWRETGDDEDGVPVLTARFPVRVDDPEFTCDVPFGSMERDATGRDVPAQEWADVSDAETGAGVTVSNDTTYGHSAADGELSLTLLRGSYYPDPIPEMGDRRFEWSVRTHGGDWTDADASRHGASFNRSPTVEQLIGSVDGGDGAARSFLSVDAAGVQLSSLKAAERTDGVVVRLEETGGESHEATLSTAWPVASAEEVDVLERPVEGDNVERDGDDVAVSLDPREVKTVHLKLD